jgi:hypothetical protein
VTRNLFLILGAIVGVCVAAPIVLEYATVWWWLSVPAIAAYAVVLWRWGLYWITDDDASDAPVLTRLVGVLILLLWSFIGLALAVFLAMLAAQYWPMIVLSLLVVAVFVVAMWLSGALNDKPKPAKTPAAPPAPAIIDGGPPKPDDLVR